MKDSATTSPTISDELLKRLANPTAQEQLGEFDEVSCAMLAVALPEICSELLKRRRNDEASRESLQATAREAALKRSRNIMRTPAPHTPRTVVRACETVMRLSTNAAERATASDVMAQAQGRA
ncbi:hypothetical protein ETW23_05830 [Leisingera sp. NJS201]|uniref:hypothetical protein n=1 Tax=Leisingera sp. NJS201 TaxID=2508306 RepID=UPI001070CE88|nr:hypothetical protein [Leisingera sp. NJS201]QBR35731.1 hypothetical protein ETW23_05830 [Leisingera sp. NJS201]